MTTAKPVEKKDDTHKETLKEAAKIDTSTTKLMLEDDDQFEDFPAAGELNRN